MRTFTLACLLLLPLFAQTEEIAKKTQYFAFGGVGFGGSTSKGETKFRKLINGPDSLTEFEKWFESGSDEARMYCLVAYYYLNRDQFKTALKSDKWFGKKVTTAQGCIVFAKPRSAVISEIEKGLYVMYVPEVKWETPPEKK